MGTNYYLVTNYHNSRQIHDRRHIGKSSAGWRFLFERGKESTMPELKETLKSGTILDEYDTEISFENFWQLVECKQNLKVHDYVYNINIDGYDFSIMPFC